MKNGVSGEYVSFNSPYVSRFENGKLEVVKSSGFHVEFPKLLVPHVDTTTQLLVPICDKSAIE